jgi:hypothetical protein
MRRFAIFAIVVTIVLCAVWTAIWLYARSIVASRVGEALAAHSQGPTSVFCTDNEVGGFPFRMALSCSKAGMQEQTRNLAAELHGLKVTALAYRPSHVIADVTAPLNVSWNAPASPLKADWSLGRASVRIADQDLDRLSAEFDDFSVTTALHAFSAANTQFHARPAETELTELALSADDAAITIEAENSAPFSVAAVARIDQPPALLLAGGFNGREIVIRDFKVIMTAAESRITANGALTFDRSGTANGTIVIDTENIPALASFMQTLPSAVRTPAQAAIGAMIALGKPAENDQGAQVSRLDLSVRDSVVFAGTRQIGVLGPGS